jgi:DcmR-like sensory protein
MIHPVMPERAPAMDWTHIAESQHIVQFYENETFLLDALSGFFGAGLRQGNACIIIAEMSHRRALEQRLRGEGLEVTSEQYVALDAAETLSQFLIEGRPDEARFLQVMGSFIGRATKGDRPVRVFGEMVALLWAQGERTAAIRLEELWEDLGRRYRFSLFCAYPMSGFHGEAHTAGFTEICRTTVPLFQAKAIPPC